MSLPRRVAVLFAPLAFAACTVAPPTGPSVMALPKQGDDFARFQVQDGNCRGFASAQIGNANPSDAAARSAVGSAVLGTALGAAAGAAIGSVSGNVGAGAAIGGAGGLLLGSAAGADSSRMSYAGLQRRYDIAYTQCMVAAGYSVQQAGYAQPYYGGPAPVYGYPAYPYYYGPSVAIGVGGGWGRGWHRW